MRAITAADFVSDMRAMPSDSTGMLSRSKIAAVCGRGRITDVQQPRYGARMLDVLPF